LLLHINHLILGKPAHEIKKHDVEWAPCINLGYKKVDMGSLQAANNRALRTKQRNQHIEEANAAFSRESETRQLTATLFM